jgi:virginiamycin A acetyltransferase
MLEKTTIDVKPIGAFYYEPHFHISRSSILWGNIYMGKNSYINGNSTIFDDVFIGRYCSISYNTLIGARNHSMANLSTSSSIGFGRDPNFKNNYKSGLEKNKTTTIGHDVWIGAGVIVSKGVTIGTGSVIGANSVVAKDIPPYSVFIGGKIARLRFPEHLANELLKSAWWELSSDDLSNLPFNNPDKAAQLAQNCITNRSHYGEEFREHELHTRKTQQTT